MTILTDPSWRQLAAIPETLHKREILHALSIEAPPEGISDRCDLGGGLVLRVGEGGLIVEHKGSTSYGTAKEVLNFRPCFPYSLHKGTPSGDLARWWLTAKGYID